jgi:hypothetical protein
MASKRGMSTVFATADALLASHASYWVEDGTLRIALPIAIVPEASSKPLQAYRLESGEPTESDQRRRRRNPACFQSRHPYPE